ncbi:hypothetical protein CHU98_g5842 [Xylaria longipes]|nr:hypothetical protein CHU98_g5842 [Xylaria longipes]
MADGKYRPLGFEGSLQPDAVSRGNDYTQGQASLELKRSYDARPQTTRSGVRRLGRFIDFFNSLRSMHTIDYEYYDYESRLADFPWYNGVMVYECLVFKAVLDMWCLGIDPTIPLLPRDPHRPRGQIRDQT